LVDAARVLRYDAPRQGHRLWKGSHIAKQPTAVSTTPVEPVVAATHESNSTALETTQTSGWTKARRFLALLLVAACAVGFTVSRTSEELQVCETQQTTTPNQAAETREICQPLPVQDIVPVLLLALAFMWPDLTHIELFGLGKITRRLEGQEIRQDQLESAQNRLENQVLTAIQVKASQNLNVVNYATSPDLAGLAERITTLEREQRGEGPLEAADEAASDAGDIQEVFRRTAEPLRPFLEVARRFNDPSFSTAVESGGERPWESENLITADKALLRQVAFGGQHLNVAELRAWAAENQVQADVVRDNLWGIDGAAEGSLEVATRMARLLWADLQRRGLISDDV